MRVNRCTAAALLAGLGFVAGCDSQPATTVRELAHQPARYLERLHECQQARQQGDTECHAARAEVTPPRPADSQ